jgi:subtilisin family serine protease
MKRRTAPWPGQLWRRLRSLLGAALLLLGALAPAHAMAPDDEDGRDSARRILVMLHLPPAHFQPDGYAAGYPNDSGRAARRRIAAALAQAHGLALAGNWPMPALGIDCFVLESRAGAVPAGVIERIARDPRVEWVQPLQRYHTLAADPLLATQPAAASWHLAELHGLTTGRSTLVAVIDTAVDTHHPDLPGAVVLSENFVDGHAASAEAHGTAVAGLLAARAGAGRALVMALRACWQRGAGAVCDSLTLGKALNFAIVRGARIVNLSLTGPPDRLLQRLLDAAIVRGIAVVAATDPELADGGFPATHPGVLAVSAQEDRTPGRYGAPGRDVPAPLPGEQWRLVSGSSYAAAHVSGLLALMSELRPSSNTLLLAREIVVNSTDAPPGAQRAALAAQPRAGVVDACATLARIAGECACACTATGSAGGRR